MAGVGYAIPLTVLSGALGANSPQESSSRTGAHFLPEVDGGYRRHIRLTLLLTSDWRMPLWRQLMQVSVMVNLRWFSVIVTVLEVVTYGVFG